MKHMVALVMFVMCAQATAAWSGFAHVTPDTEAEYSIEVLVEQDTGREDMFRIRLNAIEGGYKNAWLVVAEERLSAAEQERRRYTWVGVPHGKGVMIKAPLYPVGDSNERYYEVELSAEVIRKAYVYIDYPVPVLDGGYYYSIDLPAYMDAQRAQE